MTNFNDLIQFPTGGGQRFSKKQNPYGTITAGEIKEMISKPQSQFKENARWFIPSSYFGSWARNFDVQRERGAFHMLTADFDVGNLRIEWVLGSAEAILGDVHMWVYSSSSAVSHRRKWRLLVPLDVPLNGLEWQTAQNTFFDALQNNNIIADRALARAGQLHFLPNVPPDKRCNTGEPQFYQSRIIVGGRYALS